MIGPIVNFFGHAALAATDGAANGFVLGSMLPDFASMIGARPPGTEHVDLDRGVAFHHATDHAFHAAPTFQRLSHTAFEELLQLGLGRGPARAVAHVGVEMLLDGVLARDAAARGAYLSALGDAHAFALGRHVRWRNLAEVGRFEVLRAALLSHGVDAHEISVQALVARLSRTLSCRPRLALDVASLPVVAGWVERTAPEVAETSVELLREVRAGLAAR